ncbi:MULTISPECIES: glutathione transferase GstA [Aminobacter]|jgi:glutathione S-transferase|uniref:Glutathione S-transferase n=1 Tax=Aminobacter ciceronei TaxID=150723 RepID=A0ABR6CA73_9HYPH|nr:MULTISPECIES: glutathione transferase GstA [Aminobacter]MBA8908100.1 glutathione S-transferase [Aminobacter ciceronei]MBA9021916.1 glutathione S-transferase [Aminobacter ciceronei]MRX32316.1 glutathione transferase GstA [Aminobacter sp. MDW-2]QNH37425.1 glutathione transferase GstA [Aminobacter sp. MDW-2]WMD00627.1 glutathione transferase GstA [Aminobacter niigataensis]
MKLYYATGTCSLSPHIVALEAGIPLDIERVDIFRKPHVTGAGNDFTTVNPNAYVPVLELDDGSLLTEGAAIVQYLADLKPEIGLAPAAGTRERYQLQSWLNFVATELHKMYSPWLFHPEYGVQAQEVARGKITERLAYVERHLERSGLYLMGETFTAADAYLFTIVGWSAYAKVDLSAFPQLRAYMDRVGARPKVRDAMRAEGMKLAA